MTSTQVLMQTLCLSISVILTGKNQSLVMAVCQAQISGGTLQLRPVTGQGSGAGKDRGKDGDRDIKRQGQRRGRDIKRQGQRQSQCRKRQGQRRDQCHKKTVTKTGSGVGSWPERIDRRASRCRYRCRYICERRFRFGAGTDSGPGQMRAKVQIRGRGRFWCHD